MSNRSKKIVDNRTHIVIDRKIHVVYYYGRPMKMLKIYKKGWILYQDEKTKVKQGFLFWDMGYSRKDARKPINDFRCENLPKFRFLVRE